jgi:SPP1 family predicted phage head-tail adaptor
MPRATPCEPGQYRHRATLERPVETQGGKGQTIISDWVPVRERVPVRVTELSGRELLNAQQMQEDVTHQIESRWLPGVSSKMRWLWHDGATDRTLNILTTPLNPDGQKRKMITLAKEPR